MAVDSERGACVVTVLAPGPGAADTVVVSASPAPDLVLPSVWLDAEPAVAAITAAVERALAQPVTLLRATAVRWDEATFDATAMVVEIEAPTRPLPPTYAFRGLRQTDVEVLVPEEARLSVAQWLDERADGWSDLRPPWSRPGWLAQAGGWMVAQLAAAGYDDPEAPRIHHLWGLSVVLASSTGSGTAYLKCSGAAFTHEAVLTQALGARSGDRLPDVIAVEPDAGWLLMGELPAPEIGELPEALWGAGLSALADLQRDWLGRSDELLALGVRARPLAALSRWVEATPLAADLMDRLDPGDRATWLAAVPTMVEACARLDELGPGPSLVHGDFHPWNAAGAAPGTRIFDWTDATVSHPFLDLVTYVMRAKDEAVRQELMVVYLSQWADVAPAADLHEAARLALVVGAVHQAQTYTQLVPTILAADRGPLAGGDVQWMRRALSLLEHGVHADY